MNETDVIKDNYGVLKMISSINKEFRHLGRRDITNDLYFCEQVTVKRVKYLIQYMYHIDKEWNLWQQVFKEPVYTKAIYSNEQEENLNR